MCIGFWRRAISCDGGNFHVNIFYKNSVCESNVGSRSRWYLEALEP